MISTHLLISRFHGFVPLLELRFDLRLRLCERALDGESCLRIDFAGVVVFVARLASLVGSTSCANMMLIWNFAFLWKVSTGTVNSSLRTYFTVLQLVPLIFSICCIKKGAETYIRANPLTRAVTTASVGCAPILHVLIHWKWWQAGKFEFDSGHEFDLQAESCSVCRSCEVCLIISNIESLVYCQSSANLA